MSHEATNWAIKQRGLKPAAKIVLWHLCDRYHPDHGCFPSQETLAADCEMSRASLNNQLADLEQAGLIYREQRKTRSNRQQSTRYRFAFEPDFPCLNSGHGEQKAVSKSDEKPCPKNEDFRVQNLDTNPVIEPVNNNPERDAHECADNSDLDFQKGFSRWPSYVSDSEGEALTAWECLSEADRSEAIRWLDTYVAQSRKGGRKTICRFSRYLSEKRWARVVTISSPEPKDPFKAKPGVAKYDPMWFAKRMAILAEGPIANMPKPTAFLASVIAKGGEEGRKFHLDHISKYGFPRLKAMDETHDPVVVEDRYRSLVQLLEPVNPGTAIHQRWREYFQSQGWPWEAPWKGAAYLPKGGPSEIETFIKLVKEGVAA
ncbi:helix-turn-helix domain-containing protein [Ochrobactrum sp. MC-1LL]|uniref:helix-turn-helix domain-containing protein n=1 Tax=Ochrobactrum sp. MC-1LL TaxID=2735351 RepID=UPI0014386C1D|nr:helix-turn-helix domain-containing protein [Ochrobactrum sp. MC-1LL]